MYLLIYHYFCLLCNAVVRFCRCCFGSKYSTTVVLSFSAVHTTLINLPLQRGYFLLVNLRPLTSACVLIDLHDLAFSPRDLMSRGWRSFLKLMLLFFIYIYIYTYYKLNLTHANMHEKKISLVYCTTYMHVPLILRKVQQLINQQLQQKHMQMKCQSLIC